MRFPNSIKRRRCFYCFRGFQMRDCAVVSVQPTLEAAKNHRVLKKAPEGFARQLAVGYLSGLNRYAGQNPAWACPHCLHPLPANIVDTPAYVLGIIGGRAAGKSHYIAMLIHMLLNDRQTQSIGLSEAIAATSLVAEYYDYEYHQPFFSERVPLEPTDPVSINSRPQPLIYTITFRSRPRMQPTSLNLVLLDYAGEDFTNEQSLVDHVRFLPYVDGLILLIDPLMMPGLQQRFPLHLQQQFNAGAPAVTVLENVIRVLRGSTNQSSDGLLNVPLVLALSKADLLRYASPVPGQPSLPIASVSTSSFDPDMFKARGTQICKFCQEVDGPRIDLLAHAFRTYAYSMVSATGRSVDRTGHFGRLGQILQPIQCLDPLLWLLNLHH